MHTLILAAFFLSPASSGGIRPVELSGDLRADWQAHALTAQACAVDTLPPDNVRASWRKLGVKMYKRVAWDPEGTAEHFRRKAGFLAVREDADGVWLADEEKFTPEWKQALAEAKVDVAVALYCRSLAEKAMGWREKDNKVWIEGRRALWLFGHLDFDRCNLDTLRLEFICYAKRLEQLLGESPRNLPLVVAKPLSESRPGLVPLAGLAPERRSLSVENRNPVRLSEGLSFASDGNGFTFTIRSPKGEKDVWPGGTAAFRLYLPDGKGGYLPYEYRIDLSPVAPDRAPCDAYGLWWLRERWGRGSLRLYADPFTWRFVDVPHGTYGTKYPKVTPRFIFRFEKEGGWKADVSFSWLDLYGYWPTLRNGVVDRWFVSLGALPGVPACACQLDWPRGREVNFKAFTKSLACSAITSRYAAERERSSDLYDIWHSDRLYGFAKTKEPTYQLFDPESDRIFKERVVAPMLEANKDLADVTFTARRGTETVPAKLEGEPESIKMSVWKSLGRLFSLSERIEKARCDYILMRFAGKMPPEPPKRRKAEGAAALKAPDVDNDDEAIQLDDKEF